MSDGWSRARAGPLRLAFFLLGGAVGLGLLGAFLPSVARLLVPPFVVLHGALCLWASYRAFVAAEGAGDGCGTGVVLWFLYGLEVWVLSFVWAAAQPGGQH